MVIKHQIVYFVMIKEVELMDCQLKICVYAKQELWMILEIMINAYVQFIDFNLLEELEIFAMARLIL